MAHVESEANVVRLPGRPARALALAAVGALVFVRPGLLARLLGRPLEHPVPAFDGALLEVSRSAGLACAVLGPAFVLAAPWLRARKAAGTIVVAFAAALAYVALAYPLRHWQVDDAAITFAYAENLVRGAGLVLFPGHAPEEGYSNPLWMLVLAMTRVAGIPIAIAAKVLGTAIGACTIALTLRLLAQLGRASLSGYVVTLAMLLGASFVIWSVSGLEHGLQALLLLGVVSAFAAARPQTWLAGACLAGLVAVRPEAPLAVVAVVFVVALPRLRARAFGQALSDSAPLILPSGAMFAALLAFRLAYFGDLFPNPYYAKASGASLLRVLNIWSGGWTYVWDYLRSSGVLFALPVVMLVSWLEARRPLRVAAALLAAQLTFVVSAGGDWMKLSRFVAPLIPLAALFVGDALARLELRAGSLARAVSRYAFGAAFVLSFSSLRQLVEFAAVPTTPFSIVAEIGGHFAALGHRLGIDHPRLAHHDAGGTSYLSVIDLVDLGGLGDRALAKHVADRPFVEHYLLDEKRPDFVFGTVSAFAAGESRFYDLPRFAAAYVALEFEDCPIMRADLCMIRRDRARAVPSVELVSVDGTLQKVLVHGCPGPQNPVNAQWGQATHE